MALQIAVILSNKILHKVSHKKKLLLTFYDTRALNSTKLTEMFYDSLQAVERHVRL